ncbi:hypothetical protein BRE01_49060 [Brevibacillus reuszeri]|uniref:Methionyl-tRNA formyltransferase n=1 Tax=Brevibacillus reuszeri TaxID=54915 RepID=A0A0K9YLH0_9BACL|nr:hypothetical protein [Brevibacillus reuszeri]KNB69506.1 hypothetical protein ADS79_26945 [Brevibacillus reuszeri]MED1856128.1 hypothetical protein [Brevibacillus reuszeri]GED71204.1 hypothetical protein BRE01_49060 [Brevibacillus reuszeri]
MALIRNLEKRVINARVHEEVKADYNVVVQDGQKYIQINTYGSENRPTQKVSQTIQLNEDSARQLLKIIRAELGVSL